MDKQGMPTNRNAPLLVESIEPMDDFNPGSQDACYCGSKQLFARCCGSTEAVRPPPCGLFMFENYLDTDTVQEITHYADQRDGQRLMVIDEQRSTPDNIVKTEDKRRVTERVPLGEWRQRINEMVRKIYVDLADQCFHKQLDWLEAPDLMRYREGGFYIRHADSQNMDQTTKRWNKVIDRDISMLIYLNNDFEGGELSFYRLNYQIRPRAGAVVLFPSDHRFLHQAEIVKKGIRYAIVSWASVKGIDKVAKKPPQCALFVD